MATEKQYLYRSAKTGKFVTEKYALKNPDTTIRHTVKPIDPCAGEFYMTRAGNKAIVVRRTKKEAFGGIRDKDGFITPRRWMADGRYEFAPFNDLVLKISAREFFA